MADRGRVVRRGAFVAWSHEIEDDLAVFTAVGEYTLEEAAAAYRALLEDPGFRADMSLLVDGTRVSANPSADEMLAGVKIATSSGAPFGKIAIAVSGSFQYGLARMFATYAELRGGLDIHVFDDAEAAREWVLTDFE